MESSAREIYYENERRGERTGSTARRAESRRAVQTAEQRRAVRTVEPIRGARTAEQERRERQLRAQRREQKRRAKRRRQIAFFLWQCIIITAIIFLFWQIRQYTGAENFGFSDEVGIAENMSEILGGKAESTWGSNKLQSGDYAKKVGLDVVEAPVKRTEEEVFSRLLELAEGNEEIQAILENKTAYPVNMLEALANNPEMADFVTGYLTAEQTATGGLNEREMEQEHPLFLQWDPRWGYVSYGDDSNVGLAGCGPTSLSMALYELTRDASLTPDKIATYGMENGYYMSGTGTLWALIEEVPGLYGIGVENPALDEMALKQELDAGKVLICAMRQGDFTAAGHFIVIYGYDEEGFRVNDPNCVARSRKSWSFEQIGGQIKQVWALGK